MNLNGKILVAMTMVLGAAATAGCKTGTESAQQDSAATAATVQPAQTADLTAAPAKKKSESATIQASTWVGVKTQPAQPAAQPPPPPPAERYESPGPRPSREHEWMKGFWQLDLPSFSYVWTPGRWMVQFAPAAPPAPRYESPGRPPSDRHVWLHGYWRWTGREWVWIGGHWDTLRGGSTYIAPHWDFENGRYHHVPGRWVRS